MREKVLLLNPPGKLPYIRDYYCSKVSKGNYIYPPTDLVVLSGIIAEKYDVAVLDAMALGMDEGACMTEIGNISPKAIVALAGAVSYHEDAPFLENIKRRYDIPIIVTGDLFLEDGEIILKNYPFLDAILIDFTNADAIAYLSGEEDKIKNMIYRKGNEPHPHLNPLPEGEEEKRGNPLPDGEETSLPFKGRAGVRMGYKAFSGQTLTSHMFTKGHENNPPIPPLETCPRMILSGKGGKGGLDIPHISALGLGVGSPPSCSGHTGIKILSEYFLIISSRRACVPS